MTDAGFRAPDAWHSPATYWFWHRLPTREEVRTQVREMHAAGFRSFQVQARLSYPREGYLDDDYLRALRAAADEAAPLGMVVGVYDDYNWQTGHAAGRAVKGHDHLRERHLFWARVPVTAGSGEATISGIRSATENLGPAAMEWHYEGGVPLWSDWRVEYAIGGGAGQARELPVAVELAPSADGCGMRVSGAEGESVLLLLSARCETSRLINPLDPEAVARFVDAGYAPFAEGLGEHLGTTVRYMFFDQPHAVFYDWAERTGDPRSALPFHDALRAALEERFGDRAPAVWAAAIDDDSDLALRAAFWEASSDHAIRTFLAPLREWSHRHGLLQSGHEVLGHVGSWFPGAAFDNWELRAGLGLDHFAIDRFRDLTAADAQDAVAQLGPKLADSVARASGRSGAMVEQYFMTPPAGGAAWSGHWGLTLDELRETSIGHHLSGMRQMIFHGFHQTDGHARDHESLANPRFDFPPGINHEPWFAVAHDGFAAESARLSAFLEGAEEEPEVALLWPLRTFWSHGQRGAHADHAGEWARSLTDAGVPFRIVDENQIADLPRCGIAAIVLPSARTLAGADTVRALGAAADAGIRIVVSGAGPENFLRDEEQARAQWERLPVVPAPSASATHLPRSRPQAPGAAFARAAAGLGVRVRHGVDDAGRRRVALFHGGDAPVRIAMPPGTREWNAADGLASPAARSLVVEPGELRLLVAPEPLGDEALTSAGTGRVVRELPEGWTLRLLAGRVGGTRRLSGEETLEHPIDVAAGWQAAHPEFSGRAVYRTRVDGVPDRDLVLRLPAVAGAATARVNGREIGRRGWRPFRFAVPRALHSGGAFDLEIDVAGTAANAFYAGTGLRSEPEPDGLLAVPVLEEPPC